MFLHREIFKNEANRCPLLLRLLDITEQFHLTSNYANMSLSDQGNTTPNQSICDATESALKSVDIEKSLIEEANRDDAKGAEAVWNQMVNPSVKDELGSTPLHNMCKKGNIAIAKLLLEYGADQDAKDGSNLTPLHYAAQEGHSEIVELLLRFWADPLVKDNSGLIPLDYAAKDDIKQLLVNGGYAEITTEEAGVGQVSHSFRRKTKDEEVFLSIF